MLMINTTDPLFNDLLKIYADRKKNKKPDDKDSYTLDIFLSEFMKENADEDIRDLDDD